MSRYTIWVGDAMEELSILPPNFIDCCVTSPPYYGLRDCGVEGQIGLESTLDAYVDKLVLLFTQVRRVLRPGGTLWLNIGDSYSAGGGKQVVQTKNASHGLDGMRQKTVGFAPKQLLGVPWRVAFALQSDGWYLRSDIIWAKPNPMPESVTDRPTRSHEYIFLLAKSEKYYCNMEAIKEPAVCNHPSGNGYKREARLSFSDENGARGSDEQWTPRNAKLTGGAYAPPGQTAHSNARPSAKKGSFNGKTEVMADTGQDAFRSVTEMRNKRDVWTVNTKPYKGAHFAVFPPKLIEPCILAGSRPGGVVLDPFAGSGTTLAVALEHGRDALGIELNPAYKALIDDRCQPFML